jgi:ABC-2 type transport system ATP-binding protein
MESIIVNDLKKTFYLKGKNNKIEAVRGISLTVKRGEIFGFLGPNGAGKTTCQRMLTTLLPIDSGEAKIAGYDVRKKPHEVRKHIGYVSQLGGADINATGRENIMLTGRLFGINRTAVSKKIEELSRLLDLDELLDRVVKTYSGGQKRRLEIAIGIIHDPAVLFLDEPTTGLDPQNRANLWEHIQKLKNNGMTVFLTTHYLDEADVLADRLAIIDYGKIVVEGSPIELKRQISGDTIILKPKHIQSAAVISEGVKNLAFINGSNVQGELIYLSTKDGTKDLPYLFDYLKSSQIEVDTVTLSQPSLDDVFLKQTGRALRDVKGELV